MKGVPLIVVAWFASLLQGCMTEVQKPLQGLNKKLAAFVQAPNIVILQARLESCHLKNPRTN